ncbi:unnamed protein product [Prunus armeniaca]
MVTGGERLSLAKFHEKSVVLKLFPTKQATAGVVEGLGFDGGVGLILLAPVPCVAMARCGGSKRKKGSS